MYTYGALIYESMCEDKQYLCCLLSLFSSLVLTFYVSLNPYLSHNMNHESRRQIMELYLLVFWPFSYSNTSLPTAF
jgi:hypothetical protein